LDVTDLVLHGQQLAAITGDCIEGKQAAMLNRFAALRTIEHYQSYILLIEIKDLRCVLGVPCFGCQRRSMQSKPRGTMSDPLGIAFPVPQ
jgi:hypothetical protein